MASDLTSESAGLSVPTTPPAAPAPAPQPHRTRFFIVYGLLGAALALGIAGVAVYAGRTIHPAPAWSTWKPSGGGLGAAEQIADRVGGTYRLANGAQLAEVLAKAPAVSQTTGAPVPLHYIVVTGPSGQKANEEVQISSSNAVSYEICGLGQACSIATGKASIARGTLVRREILELALYTFKYVKSIDNVVAFMPPPAGTTPQYAVYLQRSDLTAELKQPLDKTLGAKVPLPATIPAKEVHVVNSLTGQRIFKYGVTQSQTGDAILVLTPLTA